MGSKLEVLFAVGRGSVLDEFTALDASVRAALHAGMQRLADGQSIPPERFKKVEGTEKLFEFKKHQHRFLGFHMSGRRFVIAAYEQKKQDKLKNATIVRTEEVRRQLQYQDEEVAKRGR